MSDDENSPKQYTDESSESEEEEQGETIPTAIRLDSIPTIGEAYKFGLLKPLPASDELEKRPDPLLLDRVSLW